MKSGWQSVQTSGSTSAARFGTTRRTVGPSESASTVRYRWTTRTRNGYRMTRIASPQPRCFPSRSDAGPSLHRLAHELPGASAPGSGRVRGRDPDEVDAERDADRPG